MPPCTGGLAGAGAGRGGLAGGGGGREGLRACSIFGVERRQWLPGSSYCARATLGKSLDLLNLISFAEGEVT